MCLTCSCHQSQLCRWPTHQPALTKPSSLFGISQTQFCSLRRSKASVLFWQRKQMLWLRDTSLLHLQSNGWALSRSCLHPEVFPVCDTLWPAVHFQEASEHTYWLECFSTLYKHAYGVGNPSRVQGLKGLQLVAQLLESVVTKK